MSPKKPLVIFLMGPTTIGKTQLALWLFERLPCDLISVDSAMVYRRLDIGTAKPDKSILNRVPHALIDVCEPAERYSAARFRTDALSAIHTTLKKGRIPLLVGGTGLYFRVLEQGLSPLPGVDPDIRERLTEEAASEGWDGLYARLCRIDPITAGRIHANDTQRIQRALEVYESTGQTLSAIFGQGRMKPLSFRIFKIILLPDDRQRMYQDIATRFSGMLDAGLVAEVENLLRCRQLDHGMPGAKLLGYSQVFAYLMEKINFQSMQDQAIAATCQLAKRQLTWLRREQAAHRYHGLGSLLADKILADIQQEQGFF